MDDPRKVFDRSRLTDTQLGCLEFLVNSPAFTDVIEPYIHSIRDSMNQQLLDPSKTRKEEHPDDFLRGGVVTLDGLLHFFRLIVDETRFERIHESQQATSPAQQYTQEQVRGGHVPVLGANEPLEVEPDRLDPADDY